MTFVIIILASLYILSVVYPPMERGLETLQVKPDSFILTNNSVCIAYIHLYSNIKPQLAIKYIEIGSTLININKDIISIYKIEKGKAYIHGNLLILTPGSDVWIRMKLNPLNGMICSNLGTIIQVKFYSSQGYVYIGTLIKK